MKKTSGNTQDIDAVDRLDLNELSAALRHFSEAAERLTAALSDNGINQRKQEDHNNTTVEQWFLMNTIQHREHE